MSRVPFRFTLYSKRSLSNNDLGGHGKLDDLKAAGQIDAGFGHVVICKDFMTMGVGHYLAVKFSKLKVKARNRHSSLNGRRSTK